MFRGAASAPTTVMQANASLELPPAQVALIEAAAESCKPVIVVVIAGSAVIVDSWLDRTNAVLQTFYSGMEGGTALAKLLFGDISPSGKVLPCHAAESITGMEFDSVRGNKSIRWIWDNSQAFNKYRGTGWMPEPCQSCEFKEIDFGGCRCQAFALTGSADNTDPACAKSDLHAQIFARATTESAEAQDRFIYRNFAGGAVEAEEL